MAYKFSFIIKENKDYLRRPELEFFDINQDMLKELGIKLSFDDNGVVYILEDVNRPRTDKIVEHLESKGCSVRVKSHAKHIEFEPLDDIEYIQKWFDTADPIPDMTDEVKEVSQSAN